jgi:hypothetical protein
MKYLSSRVWITAEKIMLVYLKTGNKRGITRMKVQVSEDHHSCIRCPYNQECEMVCNDLERMDKLVEEVKREFGIGSCLLHITPLFIEKLKAKCTPSIRYPDFLSYK